MAWVRLDDQFFYHAKVTELSDAACLLYLVAIAHSNASLTDGVLTPARLHICAAARSLANEEQLAAELVAAGLWERKRGGWCIHDYGRYQPTSDAIKKKRANGARRQAELRERKRAEAATAAPDYVESNAVTNALHVAHERSVFAPPNPNPNPNPTLVNPPLPPTPPAADPDARGPEPTQLRAVPKPHEVERAAIEAHPLFEPLVDLFGKPPARDLDAWRDDITALEEMGATPEQVPIAAEAYAAIMGDDDGRPILLTRAALIRHWHRCIQAASYPPSRVTVDGRMPVHGELDDATYTGNGKYARFFNRPYDDDEPYDDVGEASP